MVFLRDSREGGGGTRFMLEVAAEKPFIAGDWFLACRASFWGWGGAPLQNQD